MSRLRLDQQLVEWGLAPTRSKAQQMIASGEVQVRGTVITQVSARFENLLPSDLSVTAGNTLKYVSRGGLKLEAALAHLGLSVAGWRCLDIGLSTGGFTDCLLQAGAVAVAGFDVGHGQLHERLRQEARLNSWEGVHVRDLPKHVELQEWLKGGVDLTVVDVAFIGLKHVIPFVPHGRLLALVKPQFEVGQERLNRRGVVSDNAVFAEVQEDIVSALAANGFSVHAYFASAVKGQDGNQEFFVFAERSLAGPGMSNGSTR